MLAGVSTLDWASRTLYALLQPVGATDEVFSLVGINVDTAAVVSHVDGCPRESARGASSSPTSVKGRVLAQCIQ